jgi:mannose-6-phosphate isomerase-like protein (cupin superfamily)
MPGKHAVPIVFAGKTFAPISLRRAADLDCSRPSEEIESIRLRGKHKLRESDERPWGRFEVLEERPGFKVKVIEVKPGARLSLQRHAHRGEHWVVVAGTADVVCGEQELRLNQGEHIHIPPQTAHRLGNSSDRPLALVEVQLGDYLGEDDIVRLDDDYHRVSDQS